MFAVKGWAVDAGALKPQTEPFKSLPTEGPEGAAPQGRKRKRNGGKPEEKQDVGVLWDKYIEGKEEPQTKKRSKKAHGETKKDHGESDPNALLRQTPAETDGIQVDEETDKVSRKREKSKEKKAKRKHNDEPHGSQPSKDEQADVSAGRAHTTTGPAKPSHPTSTLTPMQAAMRQKLISARFRHLNQTLYTEPSAKALHLFDQNPDMFEDYHSGFRQQVSVWPENPVDNFIATLRERGKIRLPSQKNAFRGKNKRNSAPETPDLPLGSAVALPRTQGTSIIADLGCGDARLAQTLRDSGDGQKLNLRVLSYDLHSPSKHVTKADIANLPTADGSVDIAIFCLALMGTNWISFIEEAYRILHWKGELWIAEIKSRFGRVVRAGKPVEHSVGGKRKLAALKKAQEAKQREQEDVNEQDTLATEVDGVENKTQATDVSAFVDVLRRRGFVLKNGESSIDPKNKMFVTMEFIKAETPTKGKCVPKAEAERSVSKFKPKAKFLDEEKDDVATDDEAKVLKPCLYKIR